MSAGSPSDASVDGATIVDEAARPLDKVGLRLGYLALGALIGGGMTLGGVVLLAAALRSDPPPAMGPPHFVEEAASAGVDHTYDGEFEFFVGGGVAAFDCDHDAKPDLFFAGGTNPASLYHNTSTVGGQLDFERLPSPITDLTSVTGAYPLDFDSDGAVDLMVLRLGENVLLRGLGGCAFERANEAWRFDGGADWTVGFSAMWEPSAQLPTMALGNYLAVDDSGAQTSGCADHVLVRPDSDFGSATPLGPGWCTLSVLFSDWERAGRMDLRMTNDRHYNRDGQEQLWRFEPGEDPDPYVADDGWLPMRIWGMGIASHDLTGDGRPEIYLTSQGDNKLQTLDGDAGGPTYRDIALERGVTAHRPFAGGDVMPSTAWHPEFRDVNNDGFIDLFVSKGNVEAMPEFAALDPSNLLLGQANGSFVEVADAAGIVGFDRARGAALVDLNLDGMLDLVQVHRRTNVGVWRNVGWGDGDQPVPMGKWLVLRLQQPAPNTDAIGAWIEVRVGDRVTHHESTIGGGHAGGQLGWIHSGLGESESADVRVTWPDGERSGWMEVAADSFAIVERGADSPRAGLP